MICSLCGLNYLTVPTTGAISYQMPHTGNNYCYFQCWTSASISPGYIYERSYIQNELNHNLTSGKNYCVKFYVSLMNECKYSITELGAYLDDGSLSTTQFGVCNVTPQVSSPPGVLLTDTMDWIEVKGIFTATGTEKYLTLGNFKTTAATTTSLMPTSPTFTYQRDVADYYFDDISIIEADLPAFAGGFKRFFPGDSVYLGRPSEIGLDEACTWYKLPNTLTPVASSVAGMWVKPVTTCTYMVRQEICGLVKWDTVVIFEDAVGIDKYQLLNEGLKIYPVPVNEFLELKIENADLFKDFKSLTICNNLGVVITEEELTLENKTARINTAQLPDGIYTLQLNSEGCGTVRKRFVVGR
jgi:hypothetical protein